VRGWGPNLAGYSAQGFFKYGLYEVFKHGTRVIIIVIRIIGR
jgi:hypothetical protein